jgi:PhnB protein
LILAGREEGSNVRKRVLRGRGPSSIRALAQTLGRDYRGILADVEEAFRFYQTVFGGELHIVRFKDFAGNAMGVPDKDLDKIAHIALPLLNDNMLMGADTLESFGQKLTAGNNFSITLESDSAEEAEKLFNALADRGKVEMPLAKTEWAEKYGMCTDKFGVQWMVNYTGDVQFPGS